MLGQPLPVIITIALTLVPALTLHELAHALVAVRLGDETPRRMGRVTLNPLAHLDPIGSLIFLIAGFGWAKPVQVNPYNLRPGPKLGMGLVAVAGPLTNLLLAVVAALPLRFGLVPNIGGGGILPTLPNFLYLFALYNLFLAFFNLIPVPPLDGSKILRAVAPREWDSILTPLEQFGPLLLFALVFLGRGVLSVLVGQPAQAILRFLVGQ
jgi:Zn-dependent protease